MDEIEKRNKLINYGKHRGPLGNNKQSVFHYIEKGESLRKKKIDKMFMEKRLKNINVKNSNFNYNENNNNNFNLNIENNNDILLYDLNLNKNIEFNDIVNFFNNNFNLDLIDLNNINNYNINNNEIIFLIKLLQNLSSLRKLTYKNISNLINNLISYNLHFVLIILLKKFQIENSNYYIINIIKEILWLLNNIFTINNNITLYSFFYSNNIIELLSKYLYFSNQEISFNCISIITNLFLENKNFKNQIINYNFYEKIISLLKTTNNLDYIEDCLNFILNYIRYNIKLNKNFENISSCLNILSIYLKQCNNKKILILIFSIFITITYNYENINENFIKIKFIDNFEIFINNNNDYKLYDYCIPILINLTNKDDNQRFIKNFIHSNLFKILISNNKIINNNLNNNFLIDISNIFLNLTQYDLFYEYLDKYFEILNNKLDLIKYNNNYILTKNILSFINYLIKKCNNNNNSYFNIKKFLFNNEILLNNIFEIFLKTNNYLNNKENIIIATGILINIIKYNYNYNNNFYSIKIYLKNKGIDEILTKYSNYINDDKMNKIFLYFNKFIKNIYNDDNL